MDLGISKLMNLSNGSVGGGIGGAPGLGGAIGADQQQGGIQDSTDFSGEALGNVAEIVGLIAMTAIKGLLSAFGGGAGGEGAPGGGRPDGGGDGGGGGISGIGGGDPGGGMSGLRSPGGGGDSAPMGSSESPGAAAPMSGVSGGGANASVEMAEKYVGNSAISLKGKLANYSAAGGTGNDCADFVSAILADTQGFKKKSGDASVATFKQDLQAQGWKRVDKSQAKAGDVVIFNGSQHTELVTKDGGKEAIGSNGGETDQTIKKDSMSWGTQEFYHKG